MFRQRPWPAVIRRSALNHVTIALVIITSMLSTVGAASAMPGSVRAADYPIYCAQNASPYNWYHESCLQWIRTGVNDETVLSGRGTVFVTPQFRGSNVLACTAYAQLKSSYGTLRDAEPFDCTPWARDGPTGPLYIDYYWGYGRYSGDTYTQYFWMDVRTASGKYYARQWNAKVSATKP